MSRMNLQQARIQLLPSGVRPTAGAALPPVAVAVDRRFIGACVGHQSAQTYLQGLMDRMLSVTAFAAHEANDPALWRIR